MMKNVFELVDNTHINKDDSYILSYPHLLSFAQDKSEFTVSDFIIISHMVYGWMPTIITVGDYNKVELGSKILAKAKAGIELTISDFELLKSLVNNSIVGASKLLHFIAPDLYPIWDSRIYQFCYQKKAYNNANKINHYIRYLGEMRELLKREGQNDFYNLMNKKIGYEVTKMRAIELVMFLNSPQFKNKK